MNNGKRFVRNVLLWFGILYFMGVAFMTVYSQVSHINSLPCVQLERSKDGRIPLSCFDSSSGEYKLNSVEQVDGPWGKRYLIQKVRVICYPEDDDYMRVIDSSVENKPFVIKSDTPVLAEGMEVRLAKQVMGWE